MNELVKEIMIDKFRELLSCCDWGKGGGRVVSERATE